MRKYDYSFLKSDSVGGLIYLSNSITALKSKDAIRKLQYPDTYRVLQRKSIEKSVRASNEIEGIHISLDKFYDILDGVPPITYDEYAYLGYRDALKYIYNNTAQLDFNQNTLFTLHRYILDSSDPETGQYKSKENYILAYDTRGNRKIQFDTIRRLETKANMDQLILAYYEARQDSSIPDLLLIPCVILDFLCIHPFLDGNGRISRLLTILLLQLSGYDVPRYISLEQKLEEFKENYYEVLDLSTIGWHDNKNDYFAFIVFFLQIIQKCYKDLDEAFIEGVSLKKAKKSERIENLVMRSLNPISKAEISKKMPDISIKTIELALSRLCKEGKIKKIGTYKDAKYFASK